MADIRLVFDQTNQTWDWPNPIELCAVALNTDDIRSAVFNSLLSYGQTAPDVAGEPYGVWFDLYESEDTGSRLHLLLLGTFNNAVSLTKKYARDSLQWMINDGVVDHFDISANVIGPAAVGLQITAYAPTLKVPEVFNYSLSWTANQIIVTSATPTPNLTAPLIFR